MEEPISIAAWVNGEKLNTVLDYEFRISASIQGLAVEIEVRPEGMGIEVRGGPLDSAKLLKLVAAAHSLGKTRDLVGVMTRYPVRFKLLGLSIKITPGERRDEHSS